MMTCPLILHTYSQPQQSVPTHATPAAQPRSTTQHWLPITKNLIRQPPLTRTDLPEDARRIRPVFEPCSEPHTSFSPATIAAECPTKIQRRATQNKLTPSSIQTLSPDVNAWPRKRTAYKTFPTRGSFKHSTIPLSRCHLPLHHKPHAHYVTYKEAPTELKEAMTL